MHLGGGASGGLLQLPSCQGFWLGLESVGSLGSPTAFGCWALGVGQSGATVAQAAPVKERLTTGTASGCTLGLAAGMAVEQVLGLDAEMVIGRAPSLAAGTAVVSPLSPPPRV